MKKTVLNIAAGLVLAAAASVAIAAQAPRLADGVKAQAGYEAPPTRYVLANPTPIFSDTSPYSMPTGNLDKTGEPVDALAKVQGWDWILVGRGGVGVGYVPISLLKPAGMP